MEKICNAKIKYSFLGMDENGSMFIQLGFDCESGTVSSRYVDLIDSYFIKEILNTLELQRWEDLPRKFARIKIDNGKVIAVGNLIEERWVKL
ncbi:MAG: hypothetical protein K5765_06685 [Clostridia bacterium]|nr:hypothetical protein [Clostridia bacterium]